LLFLYAPTKGDEVNVPISGRTRLMKMGFLFKEEILSDFQKDKTFDEVDLPEYFAWKYGPFSSELINDLEFLVNQEYICRTEDGSTVSDLVVSEVEFREYEFWVEDIDEFQTKEYNEEVFELTVEKGIPKAKEIWDKLSKNQKKYLHEFKEVLNRAPLSRIIEYVYKKYRKKGYIDNSLIRERYLS
ncbi:hypothetical protein KA005_28930, partial [bacterium]|nr:hypothetical protein [bacterium]